MTKVLRVGVPLSDDMAEQQRAKLAAVGADLVMQPYTGEDDLIAIARDADAIINAGGRFPARVIESLEKCRAIVQGSVGYDVIDVDAATAKGIVVANLFDYCIEEVADHAITLTLALARRLMFMDRVVRGGHWGRDRLGMMQRVGNVERLSTQTLGIVGFGNIGRLVAKKTSGMGWRRITADPFVDPAAAAELGVELVPVEQLFSEADFITLHVFLNSQTRHMVNADLLGRMKQTAYLINTCRGPIVDEAALIETLRAGKIAGAGLDVFEEEPLSMDSPLLDMENVILTPHLAVFSRQAIELNRTQPFDEIVRVLDGRWPRGLVNRSLREKLTLRDA